VVITLGLVIHLLALYLAWIVGRWTGIRREQAVAVSFSASQKTLMIGLNLAIQCGVNILPMVTYHVFQLLADALIAEKWRRSPKKP
jgi:sodium/bile acid cotransporter 7